MSRSRRGFAPFGRLAVAAAVVGLAPAVAACDAGNNAPTTQFHPQSVGVDAMVHGIDIRDAFVLGAQLGSSLPAGQTAGLFLALINVGGSLDRLINVTAPGTAASVVLPPGGIALGSQQAAYLVGPEPRIVLAGLLHPLAGGQSVRITLDFMKAGIVTLNVPVLPQSDDYATFSPAPNPSASSSATAHLARTAHPMLPASSKSAKPRSRARTR